METLIGFEPDRFPDVDASHRVIVERVVAEMRERVDETLSLRAMLRLLTSARITSPARSSG
ncbi:MAG TPA: hypothetical protein VNA27_11535 [Rubrobacteraceae bacterium]|nr:hypothetical protein [Rubrobacteraceae bacterium]